MAKVLMGTVISCKMPKSITVEVERQRPHPLYKKIVKKTRKYKVHNEKMQVKDGDKVKIIEARPISKDKHFQLLEVMGKKGV